MDGLKNALSDILKHLEELEAAARKLVNKNIADIAASAKGKVQQLTEHPDLELVHKEMSGGNNSEPLPFDPNAGQKPDTYTGETAPIGSIPSAQPTAEVQK